jgi:integrase
MSPQSEGAEKGKMESDLESARCEVAQMPGAKLAKERKRTIKLAQSLPRGITLGQRNDERPKPFYVRYGHPRKTESFATEQERNDRAVELRGAREEHGATVMRFDPKEWAEFKAWKAEREKLRLGLKVKQAVADYLKMRADEGLAGDSFRHTKTNLGRFADRFGEMALGDVAAEHVRLWMDWLRTERKLGPATVRHHRKDLNVFLNRAVREKWLADNPCRAVVPPKVAPSEEIAVLGLREAFQLFKANRNQRAVGRLALEAFAGLRHASAQRLKAEDLDHEHKGIVLPGSQHKSGRRHYIDGWPANLWRWIRHAPADCWTLTGRNYAAHKAMAFARADVTNPGNVFRHTFATMHLAAYREGEALRRLLQHRNLAMMLAHYLGRGVSQKTARAYFLISPRTVQMTFERFCRLSGVTIPQTPTPTRHE